MLNTLVASQHSYTTYGNGQCQADQKSTTLTQMANNIQLLPYLIQLIIRLVPSLHGGAILLSSAIRRCSDKLTFKHVIKYSCKHHTRNNLTEIATTVYLVTLGNHRRTLKVITTCSSVK